MRLLRANIWWAVFLVTFLLGFIVIAGYCYLRTDYTFSSVSLSDWLNYFVASGTVGGFLYLLFSKILSEKEELHLKWQSEIPFVTLSSPCDPTLNYCDINILENNSDWQGRGNEYFSICNLGKVNAYDITIIFSTDEDFSETKIFNRHYVNHLCPLKVFSGTNSYITEEIVNGEQIKFPSFQQTVFYEFKEVIYSNYNVDPLTKEINNARFDICSCVNNCNISPSSSSEKYFFVKFTYYSSFAKRSRYKINSTFRVHVFCSERKVIDLPTNKSGVVNDIRIKGITLKSYDYKFSRG